MRLSKSFITSAWSRGLGMRSFNTIVHGVEVWEWDYQKFFITSAWSRGLGMRLSKLLHY